MYTERAKQEKTTDTGISKNVRIFIDKEIHQTGKLYIYIYVYMFILYTTLMKCFTYIVIVESLVKSEIIEG